ncbi:dihydrolipoamide acetyltransferase family protein [Mycobacterium sp.]|uniref:dihydrolipoamide acetyltransferase family protein n=1 Tax=Mycobacterium sp. TaxID=1785 RepID=UPI002CC61F94|nr:dihydrolipoamide acetyltransferase family protein [Mycobacterium sp.]HTQ17006.1 dihydrolipoamide acetyltransferase family protein [Mycobacterium sp.]
MSEQTFVLPDLGEGLVEAEIACWKVKVGDAVAVDQVIVEVETAKAAVELPVPFAGTVVALHGDVGSTLAVGAPLITVAQSPQSSGSGQVLIGYGTTEPRRRRRRVSVPNPAVSIPAAAAAPKVISPVVRKIAHDNGFDLAQLSATGAGGIITRADVERELATRVPTAAPSGSEQRIPITGLRKAIAAKLSTSRREIPDVTIWIDVDATALLDAKRRIVAVAKREVSLLALLARFAIAGLREFPELNSSVDSTRSEIVRYPHVNLGIAVSTPRGLLVPVIKDADRLDTVSLSDVVAETIRGARNGKLPSSRLSGGTFTLNNYGVFGVDGATPIINYPEAAILGIGRIIDRPWVVDGEVSVRKVTQVCLSFDHRVCDGGAAGGFVRLFADLIENPVAALGRW